MGFLILTVKIAMRENRQGVVYTTFYGSIPTPGNFDACADSVHILGSLSAYEREPGVEARPELVMHSGEAHDMRELDIAVYSPTPSRSW